MDSSSPNEGQVESDNDAKPSNCVSRPSTLNILLDDNSKMPSLPSFRTPSLGDIQPILMSEVEKILQQLKASPQTPGSFLNPENVSEDQERFANAFSQKLSELQDANNNSLATSVASMVNANNICNLKLSDLGLQQQRSFMDLCRHTVQAQQNLPTAASILFCAPQKSNPTPMDSGGIELKANLLQQQCVANVSNSADATVPSVGTAGASVNMLPKGAVTITIPQTFSNANDLNTTLQLNNGLCFEILTNENISQNPVLKMLGISASSLTGGARLFEPDVINVSTNNGQATGENWMLQTSLANSAAADSLLNNNGINTTFISSQDDTDTRPSSSVSNSNEHGLDGGRRRRRSSSSASSTSSISQSKYASSLNVKDVKLDPTEQSRMRLERKRARNRDAARKCRERKIRLIKSLEKDVQHLTDENKALRNRLSRTRIEVERLKLFVINHLDKDCSLIANKVS